MRNKETIVHSEIKKSPLKHCKWKRQKNGPNLRIFEWEPACHISSETHKTWCAHTAPPSHRDTHRVCVCVFVRGPLLKLKRRERPAPRIKLGLSVVGNIRRCWFQESWFQVQTAADVLLDLIDLLLRSISLSHWPVNIVLQQKNVGFQSVLMSIVWCTQSTCVSCFAKVPLC